MSSGQTATPGAQGRPLGCRYSFASHRHRDGLDEVTQPEKRGGQKRSPGLCTIQSQREGAKENEEGPVR